MIYRSMLCLAALAAATTAAAGLFNNTPSESDAERYWNTRFNNSDGLLKMTSFKKTDGKTSGDSAYTLYYALSYTVTDDCEYDSDFKATRGLPQTEMQKLASMFEKSPGHKGQQLFQTGEMLYEKRESGWQLVRIANTNVVESSVTAKQRAVEEEKQRQEATRQAQQEQERKAQVIAKAHEEHKIIKTVVVKCKADLSEGAFAPPREWKVTLSDSNITFESRDKKDVLWFGDIYVIQPHHFGTQWDAYSLDIATRATYTTSYFPSAEALNDFAKTCLSTIEEWRKENSALLPK